VSVRSVGALCTLVALSAASTTCTTGALEPAHTTAADSGGEGRSVQGISESAIWKVVDPAALMISAGSIERLSATAFNTGSGVLRGELSSTSTSSEAEARFRYLGPSEVDTPLASGEIRRQIGLKLRAHDTCNTIYAMWHIAPTTGLEISVKSNPGQSRHEECTDNGYTFLPPTFRREVARIEVDSTHTLRAGITGNQLRVYADGELAWTSELPSTAMALHGPVGVRADNGKFELQLRVAEAEHR
jgi:hypothetical protein